MIKVAVVGSGYWGKNLVRNFAELGALHTICDKDIATLKSFQERYHRQIRLYRRRSSCDQRRVGLCPYAGNNWNPAKLK